MKVLYWVLQTSIINGLPHPYHHVVFDDDVQRTGTTTYLFGCFLGVRSMVFQEQVY